MCADSYRVVVASKPLQWTELRNVFFKGPEFLLYFQFTIMCLDFLGQFLLFCINSPFEKSCFLMIFSIVIILSYA